MKGRSWRQIAHPNDSEYICSNIYCFGSSAYLCLHDPTSSTSGTGIVLGTAVNTGDIVDIDSIAVTDVSKAAFTRERFVATASQTTFTTSGGYTVGLLEVYANGAKIDQNNGTATNGSTFVIPAQSAGVVVETLAFTAFENTDVYTKNTWANNPVSNC